MRSLKHLLRSCVPAPILSAYHFALACFGAFLYGFPSRHLLVIGVTGTKGKTSTVEYVSAVLEASGHTTALLGTVRIKVADRSTPNLAGRTTPGRFFIQRTLDRARKAGCTAAILELSSEGAHQHRHRAIDLDALIFTNLAPEHIESHGSLQAYRDAKFEIGKQLTRSRKRPRIIVANEDDPESARYLALPVERRVAFSLSHAAPWEAREESGYFTLAGTRVGVHLPGEFSLKNALAAATLGQVLGIPPETIARGVDAVRIIPGRGERIDEGQSFLAVVDYAHTPDSFAAIFKAYEARRKICVFGSMGGGRDVWKRPEMGRVAETHCERVILTSDEPCDENPAAIANDIARGMRHAPEIVLDRRAAIRRAFVEARPGDAVLILGLGQGYVAGPGGVKTPWNDIEVAREELRALAAQKTL